MSHGRLIHLCRIKLRDRQRRYNQSEKGKARFARCAARNEARERYERTRIRVKQAGLDSSYRVPEEKKEEILTRLADKRAEQRETYREVISGRKH